MSQQDPEKTNDGNNVKTFTAIAVRPRREDPPKVPPDALDGPDDSAPMDGLHGAAASVDGVECPVAAPPDTPDDSEFPTSALPVVQPPLNILPHYLPNNVYLGMGADGLLYLFIKHNGNKLALQIGSKRCDRYLDKEARQHGLILRKAERAELNEHLRGMAEAQDGTESVFCRIGSTHNGIEIDLCDAEHQRVRVTPGKVEIIKRDSDTAFRRTAIMLPMTYPAEVGNRDSLKPYLNVSASDRVLLIAWITYTLAHPKVATTKFLILVILGEQGTAKSVLSRLIQLLIDPTIVGLQVFPNSAKDLSIAGQNAHLLLFDNMRNFSQAMADILCIAATGGYMSMRALYSDADQHTIHLHVAIVLNSIHSIILQSDLAQRCLPIRTLPLPEANRISETTLFEKFEADRPAIFRGLLDLIAEIFVHLPTVQPDSPERMLDFVLWLAAMEKADGVPEGVYQAEYSFALREAQLDSLLENTLAEAVYQFAQDHVQRPWSGTPTELLNELAYTQPVGIKYSRDWPQTPIALSKRLRGLKAGLLSQGIRVDFSRGKLRTITISCTQEAADE